MSSQPFFFSFLKNVRQNRMSSLLSSDQPIGNGSLLGRHQPKYSLLPNCRRPLNKRRRVHNPENQ